MDDDWIVDTGDHSHGLAADRIGLDGYPETPFQRQLCAWDGDVDTDLEILREGCASTVLRLMETHEVELAGGGCWRLCFAWAFAGGTCWVWMAPFPIGVPSTPVTGLARSWTAG